MLIKFAGNTLFFCIVLIYFFPLYTLHTEETKTEPKGYVTGKIINKDNKKPLGSASIYLKNDITTGTLSDAKGEFRLPLDSGKHILVISFTGMEKQEIPINIRPGKITKLKIGMKLFDTKFDEIVVTVSRFERTPEELIVSTDIVRPKILREKNITEIDNALDYVQGMVILDEEPQIRGGSGFTFGVGSKVNVMIDNIPIITGDAGKPDWDLVPVENLKQIEVVKGPGSVLSGINAMSGAVFLYTQYPKDKPETKIQFYGGGYTSPEQKTMKWWNGLDYIAGLSFLHSRKLGKKKSDDFVISGNIDFNRSYIGAPLHVSSSLDTLKIDDDEMQNRRLRLNINYKHHDWKYSGLEYGINGTLLLKKSSLVMAWYDDTTHFFRGYPGTVFLRNQTSFYIDPFLDIFTSTNTKHHIAARILYNNTDVTNKPIQSTHATTVYGVYEFRKSFAEIKDFDLVAGIYGMGTFSNSQLYIASGSSNNKVVNGSVYLEGEKKFGNSVNLSIGLRGEYYSLNDSAVYMEPVLRTGINFKIFQETYLRFSYGQGYRFPSIAEKYISTSFGSFGVFPNPELEPENGWNSEIGLKQGFKFLNFYGYLDISAFLQNYQNTVEYLFGFWSPDYYPAVAGFKFVNTGKSRTSGMELTLTTQSKIGKNSGMDVMAGYTYVMPISLDPDYVFAKDYNPSGNGDFSYRSTSVNPKNNILKYRFRHTMKFYISYYFKKYSIALGGRFFSKIENLDKAIFDFEDATKNIGGDFPPILYKRYFHEFNKARIILDFNTSFQITEHGKLALVVNNLLNTTYSLRPLKAEQMRSILVQYQLNY